MGDVEILTYRFTGKQFGITIPEKLCRECGETIETVSATIAEEFPEENITYTVEHWIPSLFSAVAKGCFHPPCTYVNGKKIVSGDAPEREVLVEAIKKAIAE